MNNNKKGFGDASCVGSGKTLTAISVIKEIIDINIERKEKQYSGFLVITFNFKIKFIFNLILDFNSEFTVIWNLDIRN